MPQLNLKRVYNLFGKDGAPVQFGPGVYEVPEEFVAELEARGAIVKDASTPAVAPVVAPVVNSAKQKADS